MKRKEYGVHVGLLYIDDIVLIVKRGAREDVVTINTNSAEVQIMHMQAS